MISPKGQESELDRDLFLKRCTVGHNLIANNLVDERGLLVRGCFVVDENELRKFFYLGFTILLAAHMTNLTTKNIKNQLNTITKLIEKEVTSELPDVVANVHAALTELDNLSDEEREELEEEKLPRTEAEILAKILRIFTTKLRIVIPFLLQRTKDVCKIMGETLKKPSEYSTAVFDCEADQPVKLSLDYSEKLISLLEQITELCEEYNKEVVHFVEAFKNYV